MDLFEVYWSRNRPWPEWDDLDEGEARKLDPEGLSLIAFQYDSSKAHYIFHLPFRLAEGFLSEQIVQALRDRPSSSRECGVIYGRTISDEESLQYPIADILNELGVSIGAICPHKLISKEEYRNQSATYHSSYWKDDDEDWEEDDDEDWSTPARYS